jgi:hypothetical protein
MVAPTSYVKYEPGDPNHDRYVHPISLNPPFGKPQDPHYVRFDLDFGSHQHYVLGLCNDSVPPWNLTDGTWKRPPSLALDSPR